MTHRRSPLSFHIFAVFSLLAKFSFGFLHPHSISPLQRPTSTALSMGFLDNLKNQFLENREGDFVKLQNYADAFGPGPLLILYNIPAGITNEEVQDMMEDGAPRAFKRGLTIYRVDEINGPTDKTLDQPMENVLQGMVDGTFQDVYQPSPMTVTMANNPIVVAFFSGFSNAEMLEAYNILGSECYQEAQVSPACAKAVPNAMQKPLRQVLEEIGGDHRDAMASLQQQEQ